VKTWKCRNRRRRIRGRAGPLFFNMNSGDMEEAEGEGEEKGEREGEGEELINFFHLFLLFYKARHCLLCCNTVCNKSSLKLFRNTLRCKRNKRQGL